ncbi:alpha-L-rhamnosidase N-terminal domain-containing protein [Streptomyces kaempferi]
MARDWNRRVFLRSSAGSVAGASVVLGPSAVTASASPGAGAHAPHEGGLRVGRTTVEYAETLLGTEVEHPRLTWELAAPGKGARQSAYQVRVALTEKQLRTGRRLVWDSGRVESDRTVGIVYAGPALRPRTRYHWQVRVWDGAGRPSAWSAPRWWETTLPKDGWEGFWIGASAAPEPPGFTGASWIWSPGSTSDGAPTGPCWFRATTTLPTGTEVLRATLVATADDDFTLYVDGQQVLHQPEQTDAWRTGHVADVTEQVRGAAGGRIVVAAVATNRGNVSVNPGGLLVRLLVETTGGDTVELVTGQGWRCVRDERTGWQQPGFDDGDWPAAVVLAPYGQGPWGTNVSLSAPEQPAPLLRREFTLRKAVTRARLHISGLAYYDAEINGVRIGRQVLDPGFTDYDETVLYAVHDVTDRVRHGTNAIGVTLGRGFFGLTTPNAWNWNRPPWHGEPRLLAQLEIDHPDGSRTVVATDGEWRITDGPTRSNSLYAGESYDARKAPAHWTRPGFDDRGWQRAERQTAPRGTLHAQAHDPIEVAETLRPVAVSELSEGVYVVDMGRTLAGWTRLTVRALGRDDRPSRAR